MAKRKELRNIAYGILTSFISRNNDVNGYWGIGKLYSLMEKSSNFEIEINLVERTIYPYESEFENMIEHYLIKY